MLAILESAFEVSMGIVKSSVSGLDDASHGILF